jgi:hypothetical protein
MKLFLSLLFVLLLTKVQAQVAVSYFPFQSMLGVSSNTENRAWADLKIETNTFFSNLNMELSPKVNFRRTQWVNYYLGPGITFNPVNAAADLPILNGYFIDFGARIKPFEKVRNFQVVFEISPYLNKELFGGNLRTRLGIAWNFGKK